MTATVSVRERPILFSGAMVRAILDGKKTQTRRVIDDQPGKHPDGKYAPHDPFVHRDGITWGWMCGEVSYTWNDVRCRYGQVGDRLWVRERIQFDEFGRSQYAADSKPVLWDDKLIHPSAVVDWVVEKVAKGRPIPSIHMPRWASRITLEITNVRVERLQAIGDRDAVAEGIEPWFGGPLATQPVTNTLCESPRDAFRRLWDSLNASRGYGWDVNPWVWVIEFRKVEQ